MTKDNIIAILCFFIIILPKYSNAQELEIERSSKQVEIQGKNFYLHNVKAGETLFSISRAYNVSEKEIVIENPELVNGLKAGVTIKIPVIIGKNRHLKKLKQPTSSNIILLNESKLFFIYRKNMILT